MIYGNESISHYNRSNVLVWMTMAFQAGVLNVGGFLCCHRFVSHITGFAAYFGVELADGRVGHALGMLVVPIFFLVGSMVSAVFVDLRLKQNKKPKYYYVFGVMFVILQIIFLGGIFNFFGPFGSSLMHDRAYALLILLCLVCGMQNGTVTTVSRSVIRTTHLTGITTDLGIGLVRVFFRRSLLDENPHEAKANAMRVGIILFFGLGSVAGVAAFNRFGYWAFFIPVILTGSLLGAMLFFQIFRAHDRVGAP
jgi:uncharacterized membrane protein YoaK (UPF0700 family)